MASDSSVEPDAVLAIPYRAAQVRSAFTWFACGFWIGIAGYLIGAVLFVFGMGGLAALANSAAQQPSFNATLGLGMCVFMVGAIALCVGMIFGCILHYRCWATMQGATTRTTPGKAVGFLFIPFYNLYWIFVSYHGLAVDINAYLDANRGIKAPRVPAGLVLATMIIYLCTMVPLLGYLCMLVSVPLFFVSIKSLKDAVVGIIDAHAANPPRAQ